MDNAEKRREPAFAVLVPTEKAGFFLPCFALITGFLPQAFSHFFFYIVSVEKTLVF